VADNSAPWRAHRRVAALRSTRRPVREFAGLFFWGTLPQRASTAQFQRAERLTAYPKPL